jgi:hypothetical protein
MLNQPSGDLLRTIFTTGAEIAAPLLLFAFGERRFSQ